MKKLLLILNIIATVFVLGVFTYGLYLFGKCMNECTAWDDDFTAFVSFVVGWCFGLSICRFICRIWSDRK